MANEPEMTTVGVVGAGTIGRGVAQSLAAAGYQVLMSDIDRGQLDSALTQIERDLKYQRLFRPGPPGDAVDELPSRVLARIATGTSLNQLVEADFVVENVVEDWEVKQQVYRELDRICRPGTRFAVNTSAIPITRVAAATSRPADVLGLHFMNPVPLVDTVEVVRGHHTSDETLEVARRLLESLGKVGIVVQDFPGFVTNRVLMVTINEAVFCVQDQVATAEQVDQMFKGCFAHRMGPLETADLIGLDTILNSITVLQDSFRDDKFRPAPLLVRMVDAGLLGRKCGQGFYRY